MEELKAHLAAHQDSLFTHSAVVILHKGKEVLAHHTGAGSVDTLFDMASVTKLFATVVFMVLVEEGRVGLDDPVCKVLPEFSGRRPVVAVPDTVQIGQMLHVVPPTDETFDISEITFRDLLTHRSGLAAWLPLYKEKDVEAAFATLYRHGLAYPPRTRIVYSCMNYLLLARASEKLSGLGLEKLIADRVLAPIGLTHTMYNPLQKGIALDGIAPTEISKWRDHRRMHGEVHDENAYSLGGVSGNAGLFSCARDVAAFGAVFLNGGVAHRADGSQARLLRADTVAQMAKEQATFEVTSRGLGFVHWSNDPALSSLALSHSTFGHTGFTGTSVWMDPERSLVVVCLTNRVYFGRANGPQIIAFRRQLHALVAQAFPL